MKTKKLAKLSPSESEVYYNSFEYYMNNIRRSNQRADAYAWRECRRIYSRLKKYQGALP